MAFADYDEVASLSEVRQRALLHGGDAQERVWAAWSLGLRLGSMATGPLRDGLQTAPSDGTRMHLAAMLASLGETRLVEALGVDDPSAQVRGTACQYLIKTSHRPDERLAAWISERLVTDGSTVRHRILIERPEDLGSLERTALKCCVADEDARVRRLAIEVVTRQMDDEAAAEFLGSRLVEEEDDLLRHDLVRLMVRAGQSERVLQAAVGLPARGSASLLRDLASMEQRFEWSALAPLADRDDPWLEVEILRLLGSHSSKSAAAWICSRLARGLDLPAALSRDEIRAQGPCRAFVGAALQPFLEELPRADLAAAERADLRTILNHLEREQEWLLDDESVEDAWGNEIDRDRLRAEFLSRARILRRWIESGTSGGAADE